MHHKHTYVTCIAYEVLIWPLQFIVQYCIYWKKKVVEIIWSFYYLIFDNSVGIWKGMFHELDWVFDDINVRGASKIKLKKVNKKRTVTVRRVIIFLNISRRPLLICLQCCLHQYKTLKAVVTATAAIVLLTPAKNLKKVFLGFLVVSPLFNHFLG